MVQQCAVPTRLGLHYKRKEQKKSGQLAIF
jgi:hypothetical protein